MKTKQIYNFKQLTKEFFYVNSNINEKNFPWPKEVSTEGYKVITMNKAYSSQEALDRIKAEGCRPATIHELIVVVTEHPEIFPDTGWSSLLVAFGTVFIDSDGNHRVPFVRRFSDGDRGFDLDFFEDGWGSGFCLLCLCDHKNSETLEIKNDVDALPLPKELSINCEYLWMLWNKAIMQRDYTSIKRLIICNKGFVDCFKNRPVKSLPPVSGTQNSINN